MSTIIPIIDNAIREKKDEEYAGKKKTSFWASESETMAFEIYHRWMQTPPTNPMDEQTIMMLNMRKLTEIAIVDSLRRSGALIEKYSNNERMYFEWGDHKVPISGYPDTAVLIEDDPILIEIKTYYGHYQQSLLNKGIAKKGYLIQLAIYQYYWKVKHGIMLMVNQGTGERTEFELYQQENPYHFICPDTDVEIDLEQVFKRWEKIYVENVLKKVEPVIEYTYKYDIEKIDWVDTPASKIKNARTNKVVIGDWQIKYSDYKNLIIKMQGTTPGYTDKEIQRIKELTEGYTVKKVNAVKFDPSQL